VFQCVAVCLVIVIKDSLAPLCCSVFQCVAVCLVIVIKDSLTSLCCSVFQCVAVCLVIHLFPPKPLITLVHSPRAGKKQLHSMWDEWADSSPALFPTAMGAHRCVREGESERLCVCARDLACVGVCVCLECVWERVCVCTLAHACACVCVHVCVWYRSSVFYAGWVSRHFSRAFLAAIGACMCVACKVSECTFMMYVKETYVICKRDLWHMQKRPMAYAKETCSACRRELCHMWKRPMYDWV